jgi:DNA-binding SARP family transcriptional activator/tetratricopeptide (TPR) repeat protein
MPHLSLSLLGAFEVTLDGEPVTRFGSNKTRALLAFLAIESARPHRRAELAGMFWPNLPEKRAAHNLSQTLLRLRHALREPGRPAQATDQPFLLITSQDVQFNSLSDHQLDVAQFTELLRASQEHHHVDAQPCTACMQWLHQAVDLYRGDLLAGFSARDSVGFEEWQLVQQEMLHRQAVETLARLAAYHQGRGEHVWVQRYAGQLVALEPWHEPGHLQLMRALASSGQAAAALDQFATYRRILAEEFGLPPSAEAMALIEQIRSGQVGREAARGPAPARAAPPAPSDRRQITALVCGHSGLASRTDPDGWVEQLARCSECCDAVLERHGGQRRQRQGTTCLIYFGYPRTHEDATRRALHAGLEMIQAAAGANHSHAIGIHTGLMASVEGELVGDVPDLARGCQQLAEPNSVWLTADTERLVAGWFDCQLVGPRALPGLAEPVEVYQVLGESDARSRLDWLARTRGLPPFVGREPELHRLLACGSQIQRGSGQVIHISGEPGIGKSRLLWEFKTRWSEHHRVEAGVWLESHCSPYFQNTSLHPIIGLLEQLLGFEAGDSPEVRRDRLDRMLARCELALPAASWLLSLLLGLPGDVPAPQTITADQRERMREMWAVLLQRHAAQQPLVIVVEDLHWSDPTTVEWLGRSFDALAAAPCLVLLTARPTFISPWLPRANLLSLELGPLDPAQADSLVSNVAGDRPLPDEVRRRIVRQTDGIPLFVEELTRSVLDLQTPGSYLASRAVQIPATLRDSLLARLDYTGAAKETAQWAAVLGREFAYPVLRAVVPYDERHLQDDLATLVGANLLTGQGSPVQDRFAFKHTLIQEAAYDSLLRQTRQGHHRRIAETLENDFPQVVETQPEVLARHYAGAGLPAKAIDSWLRAGERATAQGATLEAKTFFDLAIEQIEADAVHPSEDNERRWRALFGREKVLDLRAEREAQREEIEALLELADALDDDARRVLVLLRQGQYAARMNDYPLLQRASERAVTAALRTGDLALEVRALSGKAQALTRLRQWKAARRVVEGILARLPGVEDEIVRAGVLAGVAVHFSDVGDWSRALELVCQSREIARHTGDRYRESRFNVNIGFLSTQLGDYAGARAAFEEGLALAEAFGDQVAQAAFRFKLSYVYWCNGEKDRARQVGKCALLELRSIGYRTLNLAFCLTYLGIILEDMGDWSTAAAHLAEARACAASLGMTLPQMQAQAVEARCMLRQRQLEKAQQLATEVWAYLLEHQNERMDDPARVYLCVADVVSAQETPGVSVQEVIATGYRDLMQRADKISDAAWRRSFLENVPENRELVERWERMNCSQ